MVRNVGKLKGKIIENGYTMKSFADIMKLSESGFSKKVNKKEYGFDIEESLLIKDKLNLNTKDYIEIFFGNELELKSK